MFRKSLLIASCLVGVGLFSGAKTAEATDGMESLPKTHINPRVSVLRRELTIASGDRMTVSVDGIVNKEKFASKLLVKIKPENPNKDFFGVTQHTYINGLVLNDFVFNGNSIIEHKWSPFTDESYKDVEKYGANQRITITNYSLVPLKFTIGYATGIHFKSNGCVDYSDIDFDL
ncbi:hypothetical protein [Candidatus Enterococcus ikei]|uniref:DUF4352 domain-containing protein n=1 Tax=Candidatus Enterococcus ikei TaxID=2815326 RepID=A0ABS3GWD8_9ENTE|nr:hypothetical protein [Enterococcus sp. DIV0869a]MBO0439588.1 hypothetical protein [Enterococcus sp. DIV0869a]